MNILLWVLQVLLVAVACFASSACKGGNNAANSPTSPSNTSKVSGGWTGTLKRPGGQSIALSWNVGVSGSNVQQLTGPMSLAGASASTTVSATGVPAGNDNQGYTIHMDFSDATPPAACVVRGATAAQGDPYPSPYTTIAVPAFTFSLAGDCRGVFDGGTQQTNLNETAQLSLTKQ